MRIKEGYILREVAGQHIVVATGNRTLDFNGIITLNNSGKFLWEHLSSDTTIETLANNLVNKYDVTLDVATKDVNAFISNLNQHGILE